MNAARSSPSIALSVLIIFLCMIGPASAIVDLIGPANNLTTSQTNITFDYYVGMQDLAGCTLNIGGLQFPDTDASGNGMNSIQVQSITPGTYSWNMSCTNGTTEISATRTLTIDNSSPTVTLISPLSNTTVKLIALDLIPYDESDAFLSCSVQWRNETLETVAVASNTHYQKNYTPQPGNGTLNVTCSDDAGNTAAASRSFTLIPDFSLQLQLDKQQYGLTEAPKLTINTLPGANVTVDICPDQTGFVQCTTALIDTSAFPQTFTLPTMNKTGRYIVDGMAGYAGQLKLNRTNYTVTNTMVVQTGFSDDPELNKSFTISASVTGGVAPYRLVWSLNNGTTVSGTSSVNITHLNPGNYTQVLTAYDAANNTKSVNVTYSVDPVYKVIFQVSDEQSNEAVVDAELDITYVRSDSEIKTRTITGGLAYADLLKGTHRVFISAPNYEYFLQEYLIDGSKTIPIKLKRSQVSAPVVTITAPADQGVTRSPATISYSATGNSTLTCTLLFGDQNNWYKPNGTLQGYKGDFVRDLPSGTYRVKVECTDTRGRIGTSNAVQFTVSDAPAPQQVIAQAEEQDLQDALSALDAQLDAIGAYGPKEKEAAAIIGYDRQVRNTKKAMQQAVRDINDLQFRQDLDEAERTAERKRILESADALIAKMPTGIRVTESKNYVKYLKEEDMPGIASSLVGLGGMSASEKRIASSLWDDQQKFTVNTKLYAVEQTYADKSATQLTIVMRTFTYAEGLTPDYQIYEVIPKETLQSAREIQQVSKAEVLKDDPVLRFDTEQNITYIIPKKVDFTRLEAIKTVIARPYGSEKTQITGFAIFSGQSIRGASWPLLAISGLIVLLYLAYYFDLIKQVKYLAYRLGKKEKVHYVRVIINDALEQLEGNSYEKAEMLYKEARLTYDTLPPFARNDLYDDLMDLVHRMDAYYFNMVMIELDGHLKAGDMALAIDSYEKLTRIYERLDEERQTQLVQVVIAMGKRMGVAA